MKRNKAAEEDEILIEMMTAWNDFEIDEFIEVIYEIMTQTKCLGTSVD